MRGAVRWPVVVAAAMVAAMVLSACGGDDDPGPVAEPEPAAEDDAFDLDDLDEGLDEMREQLEELGQAMEEHEAGPPEQDEDRPLLTPADITLGGVFAGTYTGTPGCDTYEQEDGSSNLRILLAGAGQTFDWTGGAPDEAGGNVSAAIHVDNFTGAGTYTGELDMGRVEQVATGSIQVTVQELRREEFPTDEILVFTATLDGSYEAAGGSGTISGDSGVCNVRAP